MFSFRLLLVLSVVSLALSCSILRVVHEGEQHWGLLDGDSVIILEGAPSTTRTFFGSESAITDARNLCFHKAKSLRHRVWESVDLAESEIISPLSAEVTVYTRDHNLPSHLTSLQVKTPSSFGPPSGSVYAPPFSTLVDLEMDLGFIVGPSHETDDLDQIFVGLTMINTFVSRDLQLLHNSTDISHNLPGLTRAGPYVRLFSPELRLTDVLPALIISYTRGNDPTQAFLTGDLQQLLKQALQKLRQEHTLQAGDVIMISAAPQSMAYRPMMGSLDQLARAIFTEELYRNFVVLWEETFHDAEYLKAGQEIRVSVSSIANKVQLGVQQFKIKPESWKNWKGTLPDVTRNRNFVMYLLSSAPLWTALFAVVVTISVFICWRKR